ncbi:hypothetical protein RB195_018502 [Necator americanus]|uniref:Uncharacterized protein n=1 Tax=Necator americanus TaxID=51031 RepID=A0ABR1CA27_NECAM
MPAEISRYWDSLESAEYLELSQPNLLQRMHTPSKLDNSQKQWLSELSISAENECQSILYAKSLLNDVNGSAPLVQEVLPLSITPSAAFRKRCNSLSSSTGSPPASPKLHKTTDRPRRTESGSNGITIFPHFTPVYPTLDLIDSYKFREDYSTRSDLNNGHGSCIHLNGGQEYPNSEPSLTKVFSAGFSWTPPGFKWVASSPTEPNKSNSVCSRHPPSYEQAAAINRIITDSSPNQHRI